MKTTVGAQQVQSRWSELLEMVGKGTEITITKSGKPIAKLIPLGNSHARPEKKIEAVLRQFDRIREKIQDKVDIKSLIAEGRK